MQPRLLQLRRLVIGEAGRFPELGQTFYERGPARTVAALAGAFERLAERGVLQLDDPLIAAQHFNWLIMSNPLNQAMLLGNDELPADLDRYVDSGVRAFLAAYGVTRRQPSAGRPSMLNVLLSWRYCAIAPAPPTRTFFSAQASRCGRVPS